MLEHEIQYMKGLVMKIVFAVIALILTISSTGKAQNTSSLSSSPKLQIVIYDRTKSSENYRLAQGTVIINWGADGQRQQDLSRPVDLLRNDKIPQRLNVIDTEG